MVEDEVDDDAGDRDVHPDGPGPAGYFFVGFETLFPCEEQCGQHERHDDEGEENVGGEEDQVEFSEPGGVGEGGVAGVRVVVDVRDEEKRRDHKGGDHAVAVGGLALLFDVDVTEGEKDCACAVEAGVEEREVADDHVSGRGGVLRRVRGRG